MISLPDRTAVERALSGPLPQRLKELLAARHAAALVGGLVDMTHYLVVQPEDTEADIIQAIGFSPLVNPADGARFDSPGFNPWWDYLHNIDGYYEMIITFGNDGYGLHLLIVVDVSNSSPLLDCCRAFSGQN